MNSPNILSNELDQVSKTEERYQTELDINRDLKQQIIDAFDVGKCDDVPMGEYDFFLKGDEEAIGRFMANKEKLPMEQVAKLLVNNRIVSCEVQRKKNKKISGWDEAIGPLVGIGSVDLGHVLTRDKNPLEGYIATYITFNRLENKKHPQVQITFKQIEHPEESVLLNDKMVFEKKLTDVDLKKEGIQI